MIYPPHHRQTFSAQGASLSTCAVKYVTNPLHPLRSAVQTLAPQCLPHTAHYCLLGTSPDTTQAHPHGVHSDSKLCYALIRLYPCVLQICTCTGDRNKKARNHRCIREESEERCFLLMTSSESDSDDGSNEGESRAASDESAIATPTRHAACAHDAPAPPSKYRTLSSRPAEAGGTPSHATAALPPTVLMFPSVVHHTSPQSGASGRVKRAIGQPSLAPVVCTAPPVPNGFDRDGERRWKPPTQPCIVCLRDAERIRELGPAGGRGYAKKKTIYNKQMHKIKIDVVCPLCAPANIFVHTGECFDTHIHECHSV